MFYSKSLSPCFASLFWFEVYWSFLGHKKNFRSNCWNLPFQGFPLVVSHVVHYLDTFFSEFFNQELVQMDVSKKSKSWCFKNIIWKTQWKTIFHPYHSKQPHKVLLFKTSKTDLCFNDNPVHSNKSLDC